MNKELNKAYFELYKLVLEKATSDYEVDKEVLRTLDVLKKEVDINNPPFFVAKKMICSNCGGEMIRQIKIKNPVCFNCKVKKQREYNRLFLARRKKGKQEIGG